MGFAEKFLGRPGPAGFTADMLETFVNLRQEENVNLEYKRTDSVGNPAKLAATCTAFANAEGGLLILGVEEEEEQDGRGQIIRIRPGKIRWGPKDLSREQLESALVSRIHPWISGMRIHPIRKAEDGVAFLVDVPQSVNPPHQAPDRKYYLRYNFQNLPMEHNQIAALFLKRLRPFLRPVLKVSIEPGTAYAARIEIILLNEGGALAKYPAMFLTMENCQVLFAQHQTTSFFVSDDHSDEGRFRVIFYSGEIPIYSKMTKIAGKIIATSKKDTALFMTITVASEDMPTLQFISGISIDYLRKRTDISTDKPLILAVMGEDDADDETKRKVLEQMGESMEEFDRWVNEASNAKFPPDGTMLR